MTIQSRKQIGVMYLLTVLTIILMPFVALGTNTHSNLIDWNSNLVADFGDRGIWYHNGSAWHWMTNEGDVNQMVVWDNKLVVDFGADKGLWYFDGAWHWMTNKADPNLMIAWDNGVSEVLVVDFGNGRSIHTYDGTWDWFSNKDDVSGMLIWNNKLVVDYGSGRGVYNNDGAWHWMSNKDDISLMLPWDNGSTKKLVVDFGGGRCVYTYDGSWNWLSNKDDVNAMEVWNQKLVVDFGGGRCLYSYDGTWSWISNKDDVARMVRWNDGTDDRLAVDFGGGRGLYYYDGSWHWMKNDDDVPEMLAWGTRLAVDFGPDTGVYSYDGSWNRLKDWSTHYNVDDPAVTGPYGACYCDDVDRPGYMNGRMFYPCAPGSEPDGPVAEGVFAASTLSPGWTNQASVIFWLAEHLATHGFVVLAMQPNNVWGNNPVWRDAHLDAYDELVEEASRAGGPLNGSIDVNNIQIMGFSKGGGGALMAAQELSLQGRPLASVQPLAPYFDTWSDVDEITAPVMIHGGSSDWVAPPDNHAIHMFNGLDTGTTRLLAIYQDIDHFEWYTGAGTQRYKMKICITSWMKYFLDSEYGYYSYLNGPDHQPSWFTIYNFQEP